MEGGESVGIERGNSFGKDKGKRFLEGENIGGRERGNSFGGRERGNSVGSGKERGSWGTAEEIGGEKEEGEKKPKEEEKLQEGARETRIETPPIGGGAEPLLGVSPGERVVVGGGAGSVPKISLTLGGGSSPRGGQRGSGSPRGQESPRASPRGGSLTPRSTSSPMGEGKGGERMGGVTELKMVTRAATEGLLLGQSPDREFEFGHQKPKGCCFTLLRDSSPLSIFLFLTYQFFCRREKACKFAERSRFFAKRR